MAQELWTRREVDAPVQNLLTRSDVARLLGISENTLRRLIDEGEFPQPNVIGKQNQVFHWQDVAYYLLRVQLSARLSVTKTVLDDEK